MDEQTLINVPLRLAIPNNAKRIALNAPSRSFCKCVFFFMIVVGPLYATADSGLPVTKKLTKRLIRK